jgi:hypothetical protein
MTAAFRNLLYASCAMLALNTMQNNAQSAAPQTADAAITGVWRADLDGLPAVVLVVTDETGSLSGAMMFYLHMRKTANDPYSSTPGLPEPIFGVHFDGKTLAFEVSHRRAHPPATLSDPPTQFRLTLTGSGRAELANQSEHSPAIVLERSDF